MIVVKKNKFGLVATQKWFPDFIKAFDCLKITMYKQVDFETKFSKFFIKEKFYTLHSNLLLSESEIIKKYSSTIRNEINRAEREGNVFNNKESEINFLEVFNGFAVQKGLACQTTDNLKTFGSNFVLTSTSVNDVITAVHSYLVDFENKKVRLLHSATQRFSENLDSNMIARSNKYLHYMDMKMFKNNGFVIYDWGGIAFDSENKSLQGINKFKESFGGQLIEQRNLYSLFYFLILKFLK